MGKYFGTDGFRAEAGVGLTAEAALNVGMALGEYLKQRGEPPRAVLGKDTRISSDMLEAAVAAGLAATGIDVRLAGVIPTAGISYLCEKGGFGAGVMISASHNPYYDNGIKIIGATGEKMPDTEEEKIEQFIDTGVKLATRGGIGRITRADALAEEYATHLISGASFKLDGMRIGLDTASGAAYTVAERVLRVLGAEITRCDPEPNGININEGVGSTHPEALAELVISHGLDLGIALDGDADRCITVDERGNILSGDHALYLLSRDMRDKGELSSSAVVTTVMSNLGLKRALAAEGISTKETPVGDRYVYEKMREGGYSLGGEQSGHTIIGANAQTGDGILTAIRLAEIAKRGSAPLSKLVAPLTLLPQKTLSIRVRNKDVIESTGVKNALSDAEKLICDRGRIILRKSGTEPVIRITVEAESLDVCEKLTEKIAASVSKEDAATAQNGGTGGKI